MKQIQRNGRNCNCLPVTPDRRNTSMVKVRLQGTAQEIEWVKSLFDKLVEETDLKRQNVSVLFENVGTRKYYRCYEEFARKDNTEE